MQSGTTLDRFRAFVERSHELIRSQQQALPLQEFARFVRNAEAVLLNGLIEREQEIRSVLQALRQLLLPKAADVLFGAGLTFDEDAYTELLRWAFNEKLHGKLAGRCQQRWLTRLGLADKIDWTTPAEVMTQLVTSHGIPDLILQFSNRLTVVEAKTGTEEHEVVAAGLQQTEVYGSAAIKRLGLPPDFPVDIVFLTTGRDAAANRDARLSSYLEVATAIAEAYLMDPPDQVTRFAFSQVVTHFVDHALPQKTDLRSVINASEHVAATQFPSFARQHLDKLLLVQKLIGGLMP